ncbi:MAG TPA: succinyldiaminopimelate transaminase [Rhodocyclaceae bacterium]|nr:succinyldiaminopimelate transaminase [Rhodocyclaceae bacterium]
MNPRLDLLQPYPFERLRQLFGGVVPNPELKEIKLSIGEPQHETPELVKRALIESLGGLANYPATAGLPVLREAIAAWIGRRYQLPTPSVDQVLPVLGSREALFSFAQTVIDGSKAGALVVGPNPFYQIYEGAALLAGASMLPVATLPEHNFEMDFDSVSDEQWKRVQIVFVCTPSNPTGKVMGLDGWKKLFALSDRYGFVIASDECYSEIYFDEAVPPLGGMEAARKLGRDDYRNLVMFSSLSKRSNVPGLRSGFVAGDAAIIKKFLLYRTYHGSAMGAPTQAASVAAWNDEAHVRDNRRLYVEKFNNVTPIIAAHLDTRLPDAGFYLWAKTPIADTEFAVELLRQQNVVVLPGSYLGREVNGLNPGANFIRIALVAGVDECLEAAHRIADFCQKL